MSFDDDHSESDAHFERSALDKVSPPAAPLTSGRSAPLTRMRLLGIVAIVALLAVLLVALFHDRLARQSGAATTGHFRSAVTITAASPTPVTLPAFADWRVAYLGRDTLLHIVSNDGKTDLAGAVLPDLNAQGLNLATPAVSTDGRRLAYASAHAVTVVGLSGGNVTVEQFAGLYYDLFWSPDGSLLALGTRGREVLLLRTIDSTVIAAAQATPSERVDLVGWVDNTHLVVQEISSDGTSLRLLALDVESGSLRLIIAFPLAQIGAPRFTMTPDGKHILTSSCAFRDAPYIQRLALINTTTGAYRALATTRAQTGSCLENIVFQQDTGRLVAVEEESGKPNPTYWIIDVARDTATRTILLGLPIAWAPNNGPVITSTGYQVQTGGGPYTIRAITPSPTGDAPMVPLTTKAMTFPALGLVRSA